MSDRFFFIIFINSGILICTCRLYTKIMRCGLVMHIQNNSMLSWTLSTLKYSGELFLTCCGDTINIWRNYYHHHFTSAVFQDIENLYTVYHIIIFRVETSFASHFSWAYLKSSTAVTHCYPQQVP